MKKINPREEMRNKVETHPNCILQRNFRQTRKQANPANRLARSPAEHGPPHTSPPHSRPCATVGSGIQSSGDGASYLMSYVTPSATAEYNTANPCAALALCAVLYTIARKNPTGAVTVHLARNYSSRAKRRETRDIPDYVTCQTVCHP